MVIPSAYTAKPFMLLGSSEISWRCAGAVHIFPQSTLGLSSKLGRKLVLSAKSAYLGLTKI